MSDEELDQFIQLVRSRRTSQQLALENKRGKSKPSEKGEGSPTKRAQLLASLLGNEADGDSTTTEVI